MANLNAFETSNWKQLPMQQRIEALQGLENTMAAKQGRAPRTITPDKNMPGARRGQYSPSEPDKLRVNADLIKSDKGNYQAMQTTIHEGRHAYQDDCIQGKAKPLPQDRSKAESWTHNMPGRGGVYNTDGVNYRYQPVEADANSYAKGEMNGLSSQYGRDSAYVEFSAARDQNDRRTECYAKMQYGENYEQRIRQDIDKRYQSKAQQQTTPQQQARPQQAAPPQQAADKTAVAESKGSGSSQSGTPSAAPEKSRPQSQVKSVQAHSRGGQSR
ncbi:MAG: hypothetical protein LBL49_04550 [Clostridiales Family XIII bacterium]|jgi:hypothetical protein|nr:hypothetical protein [Clostridiales Family XIII bacterium]